MYLGLNRSRRGGFFPQGAALNDRDTLIAALGGTSHVLAFYDTAYNVTDDGAGHVIQIDDARGAVGFGPSLVGKNGASALPAWDAVNKIIATDGAQNWLETVSHAAFDLSGDCAIIILAAINNTTFGFYVGPGTGFTGFFWYWGMDSGALQVNTSGVTEAPQVPRMVGSANQRLMILSRNTETPQTGTLKGLQYQYLEGWARSRALAITSGGDNYSSPQSAGNHQLGVGKLLGGSGFGQVALKTFIKLDHQITMTEHDAVLAFMATRSPVYDTSKSLLVLDGNSLTFGSHSTNPATDSYPAQMLSAHAAALAGYDVLNAGNSGVPGANIISATAGGASMQLKDRIGSMYSASRAKNFYVYWEGINDDIVMGLDAPTSIANARTACRAMKDRGFKVLVLTQLKSGTGGGFNASEARRTAYNAGILGFVSSGDADAVLDVASNPNFSDPTNTTYFFTDQLHLTTAGYGEVANNATFGVFAALSAMGL